MNDDRLIDQRKSHLHAHLFLTSSVSIHRLFFKNRKMSGIHIYVTQPRKRIGKSMYVILSCIIYHKQEAEHFISVDNISLSA
jgi:hypothetical protein